MKIKSVNFINIISFGGSIRSAMAGSAQAADRPGSNKWEIEFVERAGIPCVALRGKENNIEKTKFVPFSNVANFELFEEPAKPEEKPVEVKKFEEKKEKK